MTLFSRTLWKRRMGMFICYRNHAVVKLIHGLRKSKLSAFRTVQSMDWAGNPCIVAQSVDSCFAQCNPWIGQTHALRPTYILQQLWTIYGKETLLPQQYPDLPRSFLCQPGCSLAPGQEHGQPDCLMRAECCWQPGTAGLGSSWSCFWTAHPT